MFRVAGLVLGTVAGDDVGVGEIEPGRVVDIDRWFSGCALLIGGAEELLPGVVLLATIGAALEALVSRLLNLSSTLV